MQLPESLQEAIEKLTSSADFKKISHAREVLTERYRERTASQFMTNESERLSYLISRMPATFAAISKALAEIDLPIETLVDLGAGPGTASWAFREHFPGLKEIISVELDAELIKIGKELTKNTWIHADVTEYAIPDCDAVVFSYSIGELSSEKVPPLIERAWESARKFLLVVEPGTPAGFERIRTIREQLIALGGHPIAPCPHANTCPMTGGDWCHFAARVERSSLHRRVKSGTLGYEDEKFSYVAFAKEQIPLPPSRILSPPAKHSGHVRLKLCTPEGLKEEIISKKRGEFYRVAKKADWGSAFP